MLLCAGIKCFLTIIHLSCMYHLQASLQAMCRLSNQSLMYHDISLGCVHGIRELALSQLEQSQSYELSEQIPHVMVICNNMVR